MTAFLTSSPGGCKTEDDGTHISAPFTEENEFLPRLRAVWPEQARCVLIVAEPDDAPKNDERERNLLETFALSGLPYQNLHLCDSRTADRLPEWIKECDVLFLSGGHTLMQNRFFHRLGLKELLEDFDGVIVGTSGGSMNSASVVYAQPEWEGDTTDPDYELFPEGLGLTDVMILPHYYLYKETVLDGLRLIEDMAIPDSMGRTIHAFPDGTYLWLHDGTSEIAGEYFLIADGVITPYRNGGSE